MLFPILFHKDELSYQDNVLSAFTKAVGELIASRTGVIRHKDVIDYVSDSFSANNLQTPFFVVQADFTEQFCKVDSTLQKKIIGLLGTEVSPSSVLASAITDGANLKAMVEKDALQYCTKEEAFSALKQLPIQIGNYKPDPEADDLYTVEVIELTDYTDIPNMVAIGKWFKETKHNYFAEPIMVKEAVRRPKISSLANLLQGVMVSDSLLQEKDFHTVLEKRVTGAKSTTEMPYAGLLIRTKPQYPNLDSTGCFMVPFISRIHIVLFVCTVFYIVRGWGEEELMGEVKWLPFEEVLKDKTGIEKIISTVMKDFWDFTLMPIKKKYGLLKEIADSDTEKKDLNKKADEGDRK